MLLRICFLGTWKNAIVTSYMVSHNDKLRSNETFMRNLNVPKNNVTFNAIKNVLL